MSKSPQNSPSGTDISGTSSRNTSTDAGLDETERETRSSGRDIAVPENVVGSGSLDRLVETARDYASQATAENTNKAYQRDWAHFASWCRRRGAEPLSGPDAQLIGLYITEMASPPCPADRLSVSTIERRLSGLAWSFQQRGHVLDRKDRHIATVLAGIRRKHGRPPKQKEAILAEDILDMISVLTFGLRDMRDRTILLIGYSGGLRRSEIVGLDVGPEETEDGRGWIQIEPDGAVLFIKSKTGWREVEIGRGSSDATCPIHALEQWLHFGKIAHGPVFRPVTRDNSEPTSSRLSDKHVARLIKRCVLESGIGPDVANTERALCFSGHSLRAGLASSAEVDERYIQKQLGHASAEMTRRYQRRRDRFRVNLTKAAGL